MTECNCTAVNIKLRSIKAEISCNSDRLSSKGFVSLNKIHIINGEVKLTHKLSSCCNRTDAHNCGINACKSAANPSCHRFNAKLFCFFFAHNDNCCCTVVNARRVACCYNTVLFECGAKSCKAFCGCACTGTFVGVKHDCFFFLFNLNRNDFVLKLALCSCFFAFLLAVRRKFIKLFTGDAVFFTNVFCCDAHVIIIESIPKSIINHSINHRSIAHSVAVTSLLECIGSHAHIFHTACNNDICFARFNHLSGKVYAVKTGAANNIDCYCRSFDGKSCLNSSLACNILALACLNNAAHIYMLYLGSGNACSFKSIFDYESTQINSRSAAERAAHCADSGAASTGKNNFSRHNYYLTITFIASNTRGFIFFYSSIII